MGLSEKINWCIEVEQAVASIYYSFMSLFPEEKDFWGDLLKDEFEHLDSKKELLKSLETLKFKGDSKEDLIIIKEKINRGPL